MSLATVLFQNLPTAGDQRGRGFPSNESGRLRIQEVPLVKFSDMTLPSGWRVDVELRPVGKDDVTCVLFVDMDDPWKTGVLINENFYKATWIVNLDQNTWRISMVDTRPPPLTSIKWAESQEIEPGLRVWYPGIQPPVAVADSNTVKVKVLEFKHRNIHKDMLVQSADDQLEWYEFKFEFINPEDLAEFVNRLPIDVRESADPKDIRTAIAIEFDGGNPFDTTPADTFELPTSVIQAAMWGHPGKLAEGDHNADCKWTGRIIVKAKKYA